MASSCELIVLALRGIVPRFLPRPNGPRIWPLGFLSNISLHHAPPSRRGRPSERSEGLFARHHGAQGWRQSWQSQKTSRDSVSTQSRLNHPEDC
jgi:hypothetical protein